ncbi:MAG: universal stress protein [Pseudomonadota bacterium]
MASKTKNQTILVPIDFSPHSEAALVCAAEMAEVLNLPLVVLHVVHDLAQAPGYYAVKGRKKHMARMEDVATEMLENFMREIREKYPERQTLKDAQAIQAVGLPVTRILETASKLNARMIIMGSMGRTGISHVLLGSKAEQVVRLAPIPVMIIKDNS